MASVVQPTGEISLNLIQTARLTLEPLTTDHAEEMFSVLSDPAIYEFENAAPASLAALTDRYRRLESRRSADGREAWLNWVVRERASGAAMGYVQATIFTSGEALFAYEFASRFWGLGHAREAVAAMLQELIDAYGVRRVGAVFKTTNHRSRKLLGRLGMVTALHGEFPGRLAGEDEDAVVRAMTD